MAEETITLKLVAQDLMSGNVSKAISGLDSLAKRGGLVGSVLQGVGQKFGQMLSPVGLVSNAIGTVTDIMGEATKAFREDELSQQTLKAALEANIAAWDGNTSSIEAVIAARMKLGFSDDTQRQSLAELVAITKDYKAALDIERTAMDLARLKGTDLGTAAIALGKAWAGSTTALQRMGIKLDPTVKGMAALEEVQKRVAGQAEAFAKTGAGSLEAFNVKVGELQESLGGILQGPANLFINWASNIVDVIDGPNGAAKAVSDLSDSVIQTFDTAKRQAAAGGVVWVDWSQRIQQATDDINNSLGSMSENQHAWVAALGPEMVAAGQDLGIPIDQMAKLADAMQQTHAPIGAFVSYMRSSMQQAAGQVDFLTGTWGTTVRAINRGATTVKNAVRSIPRAITHAVVDMEQTVSSGKEKIVAEFEDLAWQSKHPFAGKNYAAWLKQKQDVALAEMAQAVKDGRPDLVEQYRGLVADIQAELQGLPGYADQITSDVITQLGAIGTSTTSHWKRTHPTKKVPGRARGGAAEAGETYVVGEEGPELLRMGSTGGTVIPNTLVPTGGGVHFHFHGLVVAPSEAELDRMARIAAPALQRHLARSGT